MLSSALGILSGPVSHLPAALLYLSHKGTLGDDHGTDDEQNKGNDQLACHAKGRIQCSGDHTAQPAAADMSCGAVGIIADHPRRCLICRQQLDQGIHQSESQDPGCQLQSCRRIAPVGHVKGRSHKKDKGEHVGQCPEDTKQSVRHIFSHVSAHPKAAQQKDHADGQRHQGNDLAL